MYAFWIMGNALELWHDMSMHNTLFRTIITHTYEKCEVYDKWITVQMYKYLTNKFAPKLFTLPYTILEDRSKQNI